MKRLITLMLALVLAACAAQASEYDQNLSKWKEANVSHYRFELGVTCFCPVSGEMPVTVEVVNNEVVSITSPTGAAFDATHPMYPTVEAYTTIDRIFAQLKSESEKADKVETLYDPTFGFPSSIVFDYAIDATDDELYISVENLEVSG